MAQTRHTRKGKTRKHLHRTCHGSLTVVRVFGGK